MKFTYCLILLIFSLRALAFPVFDTKEKVRLDLWVNGIEVTEDSLNNKEAVEEVVLPVEIEQALLKF